MTTATQTKPATTPASSPAKVTFQGNVSIDKIDVVAQVRKTFDENAHKELTESIRTKGLINAVTLRPGKKEGRYELVAGERRFRAAKAAGLKEIPVRVLDLDDQAAALYQVEENIHRKDLTAIEEARGFKLLTQPVGTSAPKYTVEQLAKLVDKSTAYVYRSLALLELPVKAIEAIEKGEITPAHGHQMLRVPPFEREELLKQVLEWGYYGHIMTAAELKEHVEGTLGKDLAHAKFPKDKPYAGMSPCTTCPSNTGNQGMLFDGAQKGTCTNQQCFTTKTNQFKADFIEKTTLANLGAKFVEFSKGGVYSGMRRAGGFVVKEQFKKAPKGDWGLWIEPGSLDVYLLVAEKEQAGTTGGQRHDSPERALDRQIEESTEKAIAKAAYAAALKTPRKALRFIAHDLAKKLYGQQYLAIAAFDLKNDIQELEERIEKAGEFEAAAIVTTLTALVNYHIGGFAEAMGLKLAEIEKATAAAVKKEAEAAKSPKQQAKEAGDKAAATIFAKKKSKKKA